jgi:hypothetical protein
VVLDIFAESINNDGSRGEKISSAESTGLSIFHTSGLHVISIPSPLKFIMSYPLLEKKWDSNALHKNYCA